MEFRLIEGPGADMPATTAAVESPLPGAAELLRRHLLPFVLSLVGLTSLLLLNQITKQIPLQSHGTPGAEAVEIFWLSIPFMLAMTVPMAVLIAVMWVFVGLPAGREITSKIVPWFVCVLVAAAVVGALLFVWSGEVLPRSNHRLRQLLVKVEGHGGPVEDTFRSEREMTVGELSAGIQALQHADSIGERRAATYQVQLQKIYAIAGSCFVYAWFAAPVGLLFRRSGWGAVAGMSIAIFAVSYVGMILGEDMGDRMLVSPFTAMWTVNLALLICGAAALSWILLEARRTPNPHRE